MPHPRYVPRRRPTREWDCWDTLHNSPYMSAESFADAAGACELLNADQPLIEDGALIDPVTDALQGMTRDALLAHYRVVVERTVARMPDKYALAHELAEKIEYASDRLHGANIVHIQMLWEALCRANGYAAPPNTLLTPPSETPS